MAKLKTKLLVICFLVLHTALYAMEKTPKPLNNGQKLLEAVKARDLAEIDIILSCTTLRFHAIAYAYAYALHSAKEFTPNETLRTHFFIQEAVERVRMQRKIALDRLVVFDALDADNASSIENRNRKEQIDETLIDQGTMYLTCAKKIYPHLKPLISENNNHPTILAFYIGAFGHLDLLQDFAEPYEKNNPNKIDWDFYDQFGRTLLHMHAQEGNLPMVDYLLKKGVDYNRQTYHYEEIDSSEEEEQQISLNKTALHYAAENHHVEVVERLLRAGSACNIVDYFGKLPLHYVAPGENGNAKIFEMLVLFGSNIDATTNDNKTLLWKAIEGAKFTVGKNAIAIKENFKTTITYLINLGANPNKAFLSKFCFCRGIPLNPTDKVNRKILKKLVSLGGDIDAVENDDDITLLYKAVDETNPDIVEYLLELGADHLKESLARYHYAKEEYVMDSPLDLAYRKALVYKTTLGSKYEENTQKIYKLLNEYHQKKLNASSENF